MEIQSSNLRHVAHQMDVLSSCYGVIFVHPWVKINCSYYQVITISWGGTQCSFVDEIKLNYSLANTTLQYVRVAMSGCVHCTCSLSKNVS